MSQLLTKLTVPLESAFPVVPMNSEPYPKASKENRLQNSLGFRCALGVDLDPVCIVAESGRGE